MVFRKLALDAVNRAVTTLDGAAGKSVNVAKVLRALGEQPVAAGFFGGDRGAHLLSVLRAQGITQAAVEVSPRTRECVTVIDEAAGTHTELVEESQPVAAADYNALLSHIRAYIPKCRAVVMSGSLTPGGPTDLYAQCVQLAHASKILSVVDAQGEPLKQALKAKPGLVKPNRAELAATVGHPLADDAAVMAAMRELHARGAARVVVTAGKEPTLAFDGATFWRIHAPRIEAVNPIGSGDSFTAALTWRLVQGEDLGQACRWASAAGAANALNLMAGEVDKAAVERLVAQVIVEVACAG
jgi:tagatose 6-phosphate kinase